MKLLALLGSFFACLAVILGAFGAHALKERLSEPFLNAFEVGVRYQFYHALALILVALLIPHFASPWIERGGFVLATGTVIFSFSLYALALTGIKGLGAITPIGGVVLVLGWILVMVGLWKS